MLPPDVGHLIPGLPNCLILDCILPKLPWYARAVLVTTSKAWNHALQEPHIYSELTRRAHRTICNQGLVLLHQLSDAETLDCFRTINMKRQLPRPHGLSMLEHRNSTRPHLNIHRTDDSWTRRRLPPIPAFAPLRVLHDCGIVCVSGKIFVMGGWDPRTGAICADMYMLDIAAGLWRWEIVAPMHFRRACFHCISDAGRIYIVGGGSGSQNHDPDPDPEVYNVDNKTWELLPRVITSRYLHYNGLSFIKQANLLVAHGFCITERGELVRFRRAYSPEMCTWCDYEGEDEVDVNDDVLEECILGQCSDAERSIAHKPNNVATGNIVLSTNSHHQTKVIKVTVMR
ncbi:hypothetical protein L7F22_012422 [Adiantum nelumboides]|nr:hypothetical protein [Adiantum nelumboides]